MADFNLDHPINGDPVETSGIISPTRYSTPAPLEEDPFMDNNVTFTPVAARGRGQPVFNALPNQLPLISEPNLMHSIEHSDTEISTSLSRGGIRQEIQPGSNSFRSNQPDQSTTKNQNERLARIIKEDTSYDDDSAESRDPSQTSGSNCAQLVSDSVPAASSIKGPIPSIFGHTIELPQQLTTLGKGSAPSTRGTKANFPQGGSSPCKVSSFTIDNSDDDFMIIDPKDASEKARAKWTMPKSTARISTGVQENAVSIKQENRNDAIGSSFSLLSPTTIPVTTLKVAANTHTSASPDAVTDQSSARPTQMPPTAPLCSMPPNTFLRSSMPPAGRGSKMTDPEEINEMLAAQKVMLQRRAAGRGRGLNLTGNTPNRSFLAPHVQAESSLTAAARARGNVPTNPTNLHLPRYDPPAPEHEESSDSSRDHPTHVDAAMRHNEDDSWMHEPVEEDEDYERWTRIRNLLERKERTKTITEEEVMELYKVRRNISGRDRLRATANREDSPKDEDEDSLFVHDKITDVHERHRREKPKRRRVKDNDDLSDFDDDSPEINRPDIAHTVDDNDEALRRMAQEEFLGSGLDKIQAPVEDLGLTKSGQPRKRRQKPAMDAREVLQRQNEARIEKERAKAQKKKARSAKTKTGHKPSKGKSQGKGKGKSKDGEKNKQKGLVKHGASLLKNSFSQYNGNDIIGQRIIDQLFQNDPIADALLHHDVGPEPTIQGRQVKTTQFALLFANIPENENATSSVKDDKKKLREASKSFGYAKCKAHDGKWLIKGMKSKLYHHQLLGAQWMVQRELSSQPPHGGLLADSMGLGKTVQTLACMVGNPPGPKDKSRGIKATLIVAPATVIPQWIEEIKVHADEKMFPKIIWYKSSSGLSKEVLQDVDIVVTSYTEVMKQFPYPTKADREIIAKNKNGYEAWWKKALATLGPLHDIDWFRVVLDESQAIKNNNARTSMACQNLKSVYRWCLTGTPLLNRLEELFPYLRFLKANYSMDWQTFQRYFCDPHAEDSYSRISTLLSYTMMRRTMKTTILNRPIIQLPQPHSLVEYINFSAEEQVIYRITENRFRANLNTYFTSGEARRNYGVFMVQLLRLRQCTSHPFMLERTIKDCWTLEDVDEMKSKMKRLRTISKPFYEQCRIWVEESAEARRKAREAGNETEILPFGRSGYGHKFNFEKALGTVSEKELFARVFCSNCADVPTNPTKTNCGHIFCEDCITTCLHSGSSEGDEYPTCPACNRIISKTEKIDPRTLGLVPIEDDDEDTCSSFSRKPRGGNKRGGRDRRVSENSKGLDAMGHEPYTADSTWITRSDTDPNFPLAPSSKTVALKSMILKVMMNAPLDKIVIYVQFRQFARIIGRICNAEKWGFLYLTGDTSIEHRAKAIKRFRDDEDVKILVAGLKCGGLGLNFPWANHCISLDLWWNHGVEQQAFGRMFRIGQKKETYFSRIVVRNSIDMRMLSMQLHKLQSVEKAIHEGEPRENPNLSLQQLTNLFGFLKTDADDNIISVEADYDDKDNPNGDGNSTEVSNEGEGGPGRGGSDKARRYGRGLDDDGDDEDDDNGGEGSIGGVARGNRGMNGYDGGGNEGYGDVDMTDADGYD